MSPNAVPQAEIHLDGLSMAIAIDLTREKASKPALPLPLPRRPVLHRYNFRSAARSGAALPLPPPPPPPPPPSHPAALRFVAPRPAAPRRTAFPAPSSILRRCRRKPKDDNVCILGSHHKLTFWKNIHFNDLNIRPEYEFALRTPPEQVIYSTIIPNRYFRAAGFRKGERFKSAEEHGKEVHGRINILEAIPAVKQAYQEHTAESRHPSKLVLWTDGSGGRNTAGRGSAVVYRHANLDGPGWTPWKAFGFKLFDKSLNPEDMESIAVIKAIDIASAKVREDPQRWKSISIYSDSKGLLEHLESKCKKPLVYYIHKKAKALISLGIDLTMHWCPGHSKVPGNELADKIAGLAAGYTYNNEGEFIDLSEDEDDDV